jgi:hypothetical protein
MIMRKLVIVHSKHAALGQYLSKLSPPNFGSDYCRIAYTRGCTVATLRQEALAPGEFGRSSVVLFFYKEIEPLRKVFYHLNRPKRFSLYSVV